MQNFIRAFNAHALISGTPFSNFKTYSVSHFRSTLIERLSRLLKHPNDKKMCEWKIPTAILNAKRIGRNGFHVLKNNESANGCVASEHIVPVAEISPHNRHPAYFHSHVSDVHYKCHSTAGGSIDPVTLQESESFYSPAISQQCMVNPLVQTQFCRRSSPSSSNENNRFNYYQNVPESSSELLKKLGATEYELKEAKKKFKEKEDAFNADKEANIEKLKKIEDELTNTIERYNDLKTEMKQANDKIKQLSDYLKKLPSVDEATEWHNRIEKLQEERRKLEQKIRTLQETISTNHQQLKRKDSEIDNLKKMCSVADNKLLDVEDEQNKYKQRVNNFMDPDNNFNIEELLSECEKYKNDVLYLRKILDSKQKAIEKIKCNYESNVKSLEDQLIHERDALTALHIESTNKDQVVNKLKSDLKQLNAFKEDLVERNSILESNYKELHKLINENNSEEKHKINLHKEMCRCFEEIESLVTVCMQQARGQDPNLSLLLGTRGLLDADSSRYKNYGSTEQKLSDVKELRRDIEEIRRVVSDKYAESLGEKCIMQ